MDRLISAAFELKLDITFPATPSPPPPPPRSTALFTPGKQTPAQQHAPPAILTTTAEGETVAPLLDSPRLDDEAHLQALPRNPSSLQHSDPRLRKVKGTNWLLTSDDLARLYHNVLKSKTLLTDYSALLQFIVIMHLSHCADVLTVSDLEDPNPDSEMAWLNLAMVSIQQTEGLDEVHETVIAQHENIEEGNVKNPCGMKYEGLSIDRYYQISGFLYTFALLFDESPDKARGEFWDEDVEHFKNIFRELCDGDPREAGYHVQNESFVQEFAWPAPGLREYCEMLDFNFEDNNEEQEREVEEEEEDSEFEEEDSESEEEEEEEEEWARHEPAPLSTPRKYALQSPPPLDFDDGSSSSDHAERPLDVSRDLAGRGAQPADASCCLQELEKIGDEIEGMEHAMLDLKNMYQIVDKLGEGACSYCTLRADSLKRRLASTGTFSTVYKAIDLQHDRFDNSEWHHRSEEKPSKRSKVYVALKKIYVTSSPERIYNELSILEKLRWVSHIPGVVLSC